MDIKSILRTFRYTELSQKADRDPAVKRPPTIKFLAVTLLIGLMALGFAWLVMTYEASDGNDGSLLTVAEATDETNSTGTAPTTATGPEPAAQHAPRPEPTRPD